MPQTVPSTNVMCSYRAMSSPSANGGQRVAKDRGRRTVALKAASRDDRSGVPSARTSSAVLPKAARLGLGQSCPGTARGHPGAVGCRVCGIGEGDEIGRDHHGAPLVQQLVEGVLTVGAGLAQKISPVSEVTALPSQRTCLPLDSMVSCCRKAGKRCRYWRTAARRGSLEPKKLTYQTLSRPSARRRCSRAGIAEVLVDGVEALEELLETLGAEHDDQRQAHGGVDGVAAADPVPEAEGVGGGRYRRPRPSRVRETATKCFATASAFCSSEPSMAPWALSCSSIRVLTSRALVRVSERGEGLGDDDHERGLRVQTLKLLGPGSLGSMLEM